MTESEKVIAERRSEEAFGAGPFQDPRAAFREVLRKFREGNPQSFATALEYYEKKLIPEIAAGADPIMEWVAYGRRLGELMGRGKTVTIDPTGQSQPLTGDFSGDSLILHLPDEVGIDALPIAVPLSLSPAQQASHDLLIRRSRALA